MASIPTQEEVLAATRKSQEAMIAAIKNWFETIRITTPRVASVYAPLTDRLPKLPTVSLPFAGKLPAPQDAVASAYNMAEELLANQRKFAEELLKAMTPLMPGRGEVASKGDGSSEPEAPSRNAWQEAVAASELKPAPASAAPKPAPADTAPARPAAKSTPAKSTPAKSTPTGTAPRTTAARTAPKRATASRAPKSTDAS